MRNVYKYHLPAPNTDAWIPLPSGYKPVLVGLDRNRTACVWIEHDQSQPPVNSHWVVVGTGWGIPDGMQHVGSFVTDGFVWHVYHG